MSLVLKMAIMSNIHNSEQQSKQQHELQEIWMELRKKDADLTMAAEFGKDLLDLNTKLKDEHEQLVRDFNTRIEDLEQERYLLQRKLASVHNDYEARIYDLQTEMGDLSVQIDDSRQQYKCLEKSTNKTINDLSVQNSRLTAQLKQSLNLENNLRNELLQSRDECAANKIDYKTQVANLLALNDEIELALERNTHLEVRLRDTTHDRYSLTEVIEQLVWKVHVIKRQFDEQSRQMELLRQQADQSNDFVLNRSKILDGLRCLQGYEQKLRYLQEDSHNPDSGLASDCLSLVSTEENYELSDDKLLKLFIDTIDELIHLISDNDVIRLVNLIDALREQIRCYQLDLSKLDEQLVEYRNKQVIGEVQLLSVKQERDQARTDIDMIRSCVSQDDTVSLAFQARDKALEQKRKLDMELAQVRLDLTQSNQQLLTTIRQKIQLSQQIEQWQTDIKELLDEQLKLKLLKQQKTKIGAPVNNSLKRRNLLFKLFN